MRFLSVVLVAAMLTLSGCFGKDDGGDDTDPTPTPTATPTPATGATPTATPTVATPTPTAPPAPAPKEVCAITFNFGGAPPAPGAAHTATTCTVPAGYKKLTFQGNWSTGPAPAVPIPQEVKVDLLDSAGTATVKCALAPPTATGPTIACAPQDTSSATAGDWKLQPVGTAAVTFTGNVWAS